MYMYIYIHDFGMSHNSPVARTAQGMHLVQIERDVTSGVSFGLQQCIAFYGENGTVRT